MFQLFFELHGRYGPEGPLQLFLQGGYCWLLCTSRCVPFPVWQAPNARHFGWYGPEVQLQWHVQSCFSGVSAPRAVLPEVYRKIGLGDGAYFSLAPCIWKSLVRAVYLRSTGLLIFREIIQEWFQYSTLFLVQQRIHVRHQSTRPFWKYFTRLGPSFFSALLGSTADSCSCVRLRGFSGRSSRFPA